MGRSHDHWCPKCKVHWSPFDFKVCPGCGHDGIYDLNRDRRPAPDTDREQR